MNSLESIKERLKQQNEAEINLELFGAADIEYLLTQLGETTWTLKEIKDNEFLEVGACRLLAKNCLLALHGVMPV